MPKGPTQLLLWWGDTNEVQIPALKTTHPLNCFYDGVGWGGGGVRFLF